MSMGLRIELFVEDVAKSVSFYKNVLGFVQEGEDSDRYMYVRNGGVCLGIGSRRALHTEHHFSQQDFEGRRGVGVEIVLEVADLQATYQHVLNQNYPVIEALQKRPWGSTDFRLVDPDGYYLRLTGSKEVSRAWEGIGFHQISPIH